jgi:septal ring-binding cell division protein DamX
MLGLVLMVLSLWLAAAYLRPSAESAETGAAASRPASPPPQSTQVGTLAGRLSTPEQPAPATGQTAPAPVAAQTPPPLPASGARASALNQTAATGVDDSALNQVGLMPTRRQAASTAAAPTAAPKPAAEQARRPAAETKPPADSAAKPDQIQPPPASANSNLVRALSGPPPGEAGAQAAPAAASRSGILSGTEGFTVHLGSFVDQANAEKFRNKLTDAGEPAAIYEINMDGRLWYRVLSGRFNTRAEADAHGRDLRRRGLTDDSGPFIVKPINSDN